jgi:hypothetical protein
MSLPVALCIAVCVIAIAVIAWGVWSAIVLLDLEQDLTLPFGDVPRVPTDDRP